MQTWIIYVAAPVLVVGVYLYLKFFRNTGMKREVMLLRPNDSRFADLPIARETDEGLYCRKVDGINYRFYKTGPGWTGSGLVRFLGVEGTPLISYIKQSEYVKTSIEKFLRYAWGDKVYEKLTDDLKRPLEDGTGLVVTVDPIIPEKKYSLDRVKADSILKESDIANLEEFGKGTPKKEAMKDLAMNVVQILLGAFAMYFAVNQGWF